MTNGWTLASIAVYFVLVMVIGILFSKKNSTLSTYILGGRSNNVWVTALSASASDMSSWLLLGLPGEIYLLGGSSIWTAIGLTIGTYLSWLLVAKRLRKYSFVAGDSLTISEFFSNRFHDNRGILRVTSGIIIFVFITLYLASGLTAGGTLFGVIFPAMDKTIGMLISLLIVVIYTFFGGFKAVCWTDLFQGLLMLVALVVVPLAAMGMLDTAQGSANLAAAGEGFADIFKTASGEPVTFVNIISNLAWGLGYFGMPYIIVRFMAAKSANSIKVSRRIATTWVIIAFAASCLVGILGRAYFGDMYLPAGAADNAYETVFIFMTMDVCAPVIAGIFLSAILAAMMSTADSQLLCAASAFTNDLYGKLAKKKLSDKGAVWMSRICIIIIAIVAFFLALGGGSIMSIVKYAWAGFGAAFGPVVLLCLFWKRMTMWGAFAGMATGFVAVILWKELLAASTGVYELIPGFLLGVIAIVVVSLLSKPPQKEILDDFDRMLQND